MDAEGSVTQVTHVAKSPGGLRWSPDGKQIGFSMLVAKDTPWRIDLPAAPAGAEWTKAPRIVDNLIYRADRTGYLDPAYSHLFVVPAIGGTPRQVTKGDWNAVPRGGGGGWDWLPDGRTVIVAGNDSSDAERMYQRQNLYAIDVMTGAKRLLTTKAGQWGNPVVSPDGKLIAFQGFPAEGPSSYHASDLYTIAPDGSGMTLRTAGLDRDPNDVAWSADGKGLYFTAEDRGTSNLWFAALGSAARQITTGTHVIGNAAVTRNGTVYAVRTNYNRPPDVIKFEVKKPAEMSQLTDVNADLLTGTRLGDVEEIWYTSTNGAKIQGWVVKPPSFDPSRKYPLIFEIHGGPHGDYNTAFNFLVPELRRERIRGALHQSARQHRIRHRVRQRDHA